MDDDAPDPLAAFRAINCDATEHLARQAAQAGVKRMVYVSSIKVNGERTTDRPFRASDAPAPHDPYGVSKWEAEQVLARIAATTTLEVVILRPPLIYGPGVKANFLRLMQAIQRGLPMPRVNNKRSLLYVDNLADAIRACLTHPDAAGKTYLLSDGAPLSTAQLSRQLAAALGKSSRLIPTPMALLRIAGTITRRQAVVARLLDSLEVDSSDLERDLGWQPPHSVEEGLAATASWYQSTSA
jgi:nucleoside-diphosphate-sugar epimerase